MQRLYLFFLFLTLSACKPAGHSVHVAVIQDPTCGCDVPFESFTNTLAPITDVVTSDAPRDGLIVEGFSVDARIDNSLPPDSIAQAPNLLMLDEGQRRKAKEAFDLEKSFRRPYLLPADTTASLVYARMRAAAISLSKRRADDQIILLYSDGLEHSDSLSIYIRDTPKLLLQNEQAARSFIRGLKNLYGPLPDMDGITVIHINRPTKRDEQLYKSASHIIETYVTDAGGTYEYRTPSISPLNASR